MQPVLLLLLRGKRFLSKSLV
jgi:hypothetical protein